MKTRTGLLLGTALGRGRYEGEFSQMHPEGSRLHGAYSLNRPGEERDGESRRGREEKGEEPQTKRHRVIQDTKKVYSRND